MADKITVRQLADLLEGEAEGDLSRQLAAVSTLESAGAEELAFAESEKTRVLALESQAGCVLAPPSLPLPGKTVIRVADPRRAMTRAIELLCPPEATAPGIHPTAQIGSGVNLGKEISIGPWTAVADNCRIGARTRIGAGCVLGRDSVLGDDCLLHPHVTLYARTLIGSRVILHSGAVLGSDGFGYTRDERGYRKFPQVGWVEAGDDVEIGANSTVDRGALGPTRIGCGTKIDNLVHVAHSVQIGKHCAIAAQVGIAGSTVIADYVVMGGQVGIADHVRVEKGAVLGAQCGILPHKIVRAGQTVWGTPSRPLKEHLEQQALLARMSRKKHKSED